MKAKASHLSKCIVGFFGATGTALGFVRDTKMRVSSLSLPVLIWQIEFGSDP